MGAYLASLKGVQTSTAVRLSPFVNESTAALYVAKSIGTQAVPAAKTATAGISAAELIAGLVTTTGVTAPSIHQLPTGQALDDILVDAAVGDCFDFWLINTGTGASDDATITVNTDVTIVGSPTVGSLTDATIISGSGHFRARRSAASPARMRRRS